MKPGAKSPGRRSIHCAIAAGGKNCTPSISASAGAERPVVLSAIKPDEFLARFLRGLKFRDAGQAARDPEFLVQFARSGCIVFFPGAHVTRGAGIPEVWVPIFPAGTFLQKHFTSRVENEDVHGAMSQVIPMHFGPRGAAYDPILFIDHREQLVPGSLPAAGDAGWRTKLVKQIHCSSDNSSARAVSGSINLLRGHRPIGSQAS